jgi:hypothetical protein
MNLCLCTKSNSDSPVTEGGKNPQNGMWGRNMRQISLSLDAATLNFVFLRRGGGIHPTCSYVMQPIYDEVDV